MSDPTGDRKVGKIQESVYETRVREVMTKDVITARPMTSMSELGEILRKNRIAGVPVVDEGRVVGIASLEDFIRWLEGGRKNAYVGSLMSRNVTVVYEDEPVVYAFNMFETSGFGRFPVLDRDTRGLVGIITKGDIVRGLLKKLEVDFERRESVPCRPEGLLECISAPRKALLFEYDVLGQDFKRAGECSGRVKMNLRRLGLHPGVIRRVSIACYEAEMNIVIFARKGKIRARVEPGMITVQVEDSGPGIPDVEKAREPGYSTAPEWIREMGFGAGMGLYNIERCTDTMEIESTLGEGTRIFFSVALGARHESRSTG